jgi:hypothetical protein
MDGEKPVRVNDMQALGPVYGTGEGVGEGEAARDGEGEAVGEGEGHPFSTHTMDGLESTGHGCPLTPLVKR